MEHTLKSTVSVADKTRETEDLVTTIDASKITTLAVSTLEALRIRGGGPPFFKIGRRVVYSRSDLLAFARGDRRASTSDTVPA